MKLIPENFTVLVGDTIYAVVFKSRLPKMGYKNGIDGYCCPEKCVIAIRKGLTLERTFEILVHEYLHACEFEYEFELTHEVIELLEEPIRRLLLDNYL